VVGRLRHLAVDPRDAVAEPRKPIKKGPNLQRRKCTMSWIALATVALFIYWLASTAKTRTLDARKQELETWDLHEGDEYGHLTTTVNFPAMQMRTEEVLSESNQRRYRESALRRTASVTGSTN
jgi:hypothetical protein